ncbi:helix-turn-helix domain-containing protein [Streptomyces sp. NPDC059373]
MAIGIAVYIQSLPDGVPVGIRELTARFREGEMTIARALRELEAAGYLERRRERLADGRMVTRTTFFERPGAAPAAPVVRERAAPRPGPRTEPVPEGPVDPVAAAVLAGLRGCDERLVLSGRDVRRLAPGLSAWLERGVTPEQARAVLCGLLPVGEIAKPAGLIAWRLRELMPPALPAAPPQGPARPEPMQVCEGCERGFRAPDPGHCRECREDAAAA